MHVFKLGLSGELSCADHMGRIEIHRVEFDMWVCGCQQICRDPLTAAQFTISQLGSVQPVFLPLRDGAEGEVGRRQFAKKVMCVIKIGHIAGSPVVHIAPCWSEVCSNAA
jgi:hypothetical protein